jgi:cytoskeletal protein RodZ
MPNNDASEPKIEIDAKLQTAIKRAEAEVERVKKWLAKEQPEVPPRKNSETVPKGDTHTRVTLNASEKFRSHKLESPGELVDELKALSSEVKSWKTESRQRLTDKNAADRKGRIIATLSVVVAVIFGTIGLWININRQADKVQNKIEESQLVLTSPSEGTEVGLGHRVLGKTPFPQLNHYIAVRVVRTGSTYFQPAFVSPDGSFSGEARFGDAASGEDDEYTIRALATKATLVTGNLTEVPSDAVWSDFVTVRRVQSSPVAGTQIAITTPTEGAEVGADSTISGKTSFTDLNHYIVVTPTRIGTSFVQNQPALVNRADGSFTWRATFGGAQVGVGEQFTVRVLATKSTLPEAPLTKEPADAVSSNLVTVKRK